jgi:hypothetical protein
VSKDVFRFEEPPPAKRYMHKATAARLRENPGQWALIAVYDQRTNAGSMRRRISQGLGENWQRPGDFEAQVRRIEDEFKLYARYTGEGEEQSDE